MAGPGHRPVRRWTANEGSDVARSFGRLPLARAGPRPRSRWNGFRRAPPAATIPARVLHGARPRPGASSISPAPLPHVRAPLPARPVVRVSLAAAVRRAAAPVPCSGSVCLAARKTRRVHRGETAIWRPASLPSPPTAQSAAAAGFPISAATRPKPSRAPWPNWPGLTPRTSCSSGPSAPVSPPSVRAILTGPTRPVSPTRATSEASGKKQTRRRAPP